MTDIYDHAEFEPRWRAKWEATGLYRRPENPARPLYALTMYPYPSGNLHIGHWYAYAPSDASARFRRMRGHDVFFPIGFDAFGLPAENAAIKRGAEPKAWTLSNIERMREQFKSMGAMFDWCAEVVTCDPGYYRWNQWFFLKFLERGLAYRKRAPVDWCPSCNTTLAREQVVGENRECERCGTPVVKKELDQWLFGITRYADELLEGLDGLDWPERVKTMQRNWIGRSVGAEIKFPLTGHDAEITVFTTRPDTLFGATAVVLAPEHPLAMEIATEDRREAVSDYRGQAERQTEIDRLAADRPKTGVFTGGFASHPLSSERLPVWVADYVLPTYGHGAVMLVPAHDERDHVFALKHDLPIREVVRQSQLPSDESADSVAAEVAAGLPYMGPGVLVGSGEFDGLISLGKHSRDGWTPELAEAHGIPAHVDDDTDAKTAIAHALDERELGGSAVTYRLRDWLISRQRYWGTPIPVVHCPECGIVPVPEDELPVILPEVREFRPTGESPLRFADDWRQVECPHCGGAAERDTDTMDTFVDSSWYQYRYLSPAFADGPFDPEEAEWLPIDRYTGGIEHATMHLLYTRFWTKVMRDMGMVDFDEPMQFLFNQGIILGEDSEKMSKSRGNVVDPDELVALYGADAVRAYLMFIGPWDQGGPWDSRGIQGVVRFLRDVWELAGETSVGQNGSGEDTGESGTEADERRLRRVLHQTIERVTDDYEGYAFNTAIAAMMELRNALKDARGRLFGTAAWTESINTLLLLLAPVAPHMTEELWSRRGHGYSIHEQPWPEHDPAVAAEDSVEIGVQVAGKLRDRVVLPVGASEPEVVAAALASPAVRRELDGASPKRVIYVPGRLVNVVP